MASWGFIADASFDAASNVSGSDFIIFEVNAWHNLVHVASGLVGLALGTEPGDRVNVRAGFGAIYAVVTLWGFLDGTMSWG